MRSTFVFGEAGDSGFRTVGSVPANRCSRTEGAMDQLPAPPRMRPIGLRSVDQSY